MKKARPPATNNKRSRNRIIYICTTETTRVSYVSIMEFCGTRVHDAIREKSMHIYETAKYTHYYLSYLQTRDALGVLCSRQYALAT